MKVITLKPVPIHSNKTGSDYVKVAFISEKGVQGEIFVGKAEFDALNFPVNKCLTDADVATLFKDYNTVEVEFNERGRVVSAE